MEDRCVSFVRVIPPMTAYGERFKELDALDFKIIKAMYTKEVRNISRLARVVGIPQQTLSYRVRKFDKQDLLRFRALINEPKLGLKTYLVISRSRPGKEEISGRAMTCFPLWRYLAIVDGWKHGNYVRYVIPPDKEMDLRAFLSELKKRDLILDFDIYPIISPNYPLLNLDFYIDKKGIPIFNWKKWVDNYDNFKEESLVEPKSYEKAKFDLYDLIILRCLEINARMKLRNVVKEMAKILQEEEYKRFIPLVSRRLKYNILPQGLIRGYRAYLFPNPGPNTLFLVYYFSFTSGPSLSKFVSGLNYLPYNTAYQKVLEKNELFVHLVIPAYEYSNIRRAIFKLGEKGHIKDEYLLFGDLMHATWDNVALYQMYKDEAWNFSYGIALEMLENIY
jgi:DNA-binding Lrp family transcriptional regulator